jgi:Fic family protein
MMASQSSAKAPPRTTSQRAGRFILAQGPPEPFYAFHPEPLPPKPKLLIDARLHSLLDRANQALGRLDGVTLLLPDPGHFLYSYIRKEAVLSSQIEGTQSSLSDLLLFEQDVAPGVPMGDVQETANYLRAMDHGLSRVREEFPLSLRLLKEVHRLLLEGGRGQERDPGEFRRTQNWIGGTRPGNATFVPPPAHEAQVSIGLLERFLHDDPVATPILIKAALAHAQFETIHPFLDGNGRVGRLLITLLLCSEKVLSQPLLYLSLYLRRNRTEYYDHLQAIRFHGRWEEWLEFFLEGVIEVAEGATETTRRIVAMIERDRAKLHTLGRAAATALSLHEYAIRHVLLRAPIAADALGVTEPTIYNAIRNLTGAQILREITGRTWGRVHIYDEFLMILNEGTEVEPA